MSNTSMKSMNEKKLRVNNLDEFNKNIRTKNNICCSQSQSNSNSEHLKTTYPVNFLGVGRMCEE